MRPAQQMNVECPVRPIGRNIDGARRAWRADLAWTIACSTSAKSKAFGCLFGMLVLGGSAGPHSLILDFASADVPSEYINRMRDALIDNCVLLQALFVLAIRGYICCMTGCALHTHTIDQILQAYNMAVPLLPNFNISSPAYLNDGSISADCRFVLNIFKSTNRQANGAKREILRFKFRLVQLPHGWPLSPQPPPPLVVRAGEGLHSIRPAQFATRSFDSGCSAFRLDAQLQKRFLTSISALGSSTPRRKRVPSLDVGLAGRSSARHPSAPMGLQRFVAMLLLACGANAFRVRAPWKQEVEKKHGRVAMLAVPALIALGAGGVEEPVRWLSQQPIDAQAGFFAAAGVLEAATSLPRLEYNFTLKEGVVPGVYPPLGPPDTQIDQVETNVGRLAMITAASMLAENLFFA